MHITILSVLYEWLYRYTCVHMKTNFGGYILVIWHTRISWAPRIFWASYLPSIVKQDINTVYVPMNKVNYSAINQSVTLKYKIIYAYRIYVTLWDFQVVSIGSKFTHCSLSKKIITRKHSWHYLWALPYVTKYLHAFKLDYGLELLNKHAVVM